MALHKTDTNQTTYGKIFIAAFTPSYARLELYSLLEKLDRRVLYTDTDSAIFVTRLGDWVPPLGPFLGDFTNELPDGDSIAQFVSGGPKT